MKYKIKNGGEVNLTRRNFISSGGEGSIFSHAGKAFKIYHDPKKMIPLGKLTELWSIVDPKVIRPEEIILQKDKPVGYSMKLVSNTNPLCKLFTKSFKNRNSLSDNAMLDLVQGFQSTVESVHESGVLIVDLNEMNFLVDEKFTDVYFIDVDSYQTPHFPATALMDSVKDWQAHGKWTQGSDWFSWAVVSFQMIMGIHPFKGKHPNITGMDTRMQKNVSVFNREVTTPKMVPSFDVLPVEYRDWYRAVFEEGKRVPPPGGKLTLAAIMTTVRPISSSAAVTISLFDKFDEKVTYFRHLNGWDIVQTDLTAHIGTNHQYTPWLTMPGKSWLATDSKGNVARVRGTASNELHIHSLNEKDSQAVYHMAHDQIMEYEGRVYFKNDDRILELEIMNLKSGLKATSKIVANVMPNATKFYDGVAIQDMLGDWFVSMFPKSGWHEQYKLTDLDGYKITDAKFDNGVLIVIGSKNGKYDKFVYRVDGGELKLFWRDQDIAYSGINFVTLDNGICVHIDENEDLLLFSKHIHSDKVKKIQDPVLGNDMQLCKQGNRVLFIRGTEIFTVTTK